MGLNLGWVYLFMGVVIGSAVIPLWNMMTWSKASGKGAVIAAWSGFALAVIGWLSGAQIQSGSISVATLGSNEVMLSGNLIAIISSGIIHYVYSKFVDPQDFDFSTLDSMIHLVEQDLSGLGAEQQDKNELRRTKRWITRRGYVLTFVLAIAWPALSLPAKIFTRDYFAFWVLLSVAWGFGAAIVSSFLPLFESQDEIFRVLSGMYNMITGKKGNVEDEEEPIKSLRKGTMDGESEEESAETPEDEEVELAEVSSEKDFEDFQAELKA